MPQLLTDNQRGFQPVVAARGDPIHPTAHFPQPSPPITPDVRVEHAPQPVPYTVFHGIGRDGQHAPTGMRRYLGGLAIAEVLSVAGWPFQVPKVYNAIQVNMPRGRQLPMRERVNISMPAQTTLGDQATVTGSGGVSDMSLLKLILP